MGFELRTAFIAVALPSVLVIRKKDIKAKERKGTVPAQGYVWVD
jgi:hypothetical protein